ncbi:calcium-binding protein, partial [Microvirga sp. 2YAF29]|uniref:calcium-binding protein n=1 Tax=Microvirga sp. 2YAF29 TaxID=3233031 RepID=UPI003F997976
MKIINTVQPTQTADETHASVAAFGETYFVDSGGALSATGSRANGIHAVSGPLTAMVLGSISATQWGIYAASWDNLIEVGVGGSVYGEGRGIFVAGSPDDIAFHTLTNFGFIGGKNEGVRLEGYVTTTYNEGTISSQSGTAIVLDGGFAPAGRVGRMSLLNTGMIFGGGLSAKYAIQGMNGNATIVNSGTISGNVVLGSGDDSFDNRDGTLVNGTISLGDGNDRIWSGNGNDGIITGKGADSIDGGEGTDSLSLSSGADNVTVDLREVNSQATGIGQKTILNIEDVGSGNGDDQLTGNSANNQIATGAGNDTLDGWYGDDTLNGGFGTDTALFSGSAGARVDLTKQGEKQNTGYGLDTLFAIENLEGGAGSDWFKGDANANLLSGNGGNDTLAGGLGDDTLDGGAGINTAVFAGQAAD